MALASLPADVVRSIISFIPLRPRLLVVARVCRRWRSVAYASVTAITEPYTYAGPYERYPNLTACAFHGASAPEAWTEEQRARITSAELRLVQAGDAAAPALPSLTSLRLDIEKPASVTGATRLLAHVASSLASLVIAHACLSSSRADEVLPRLPALRSLELYGCYGFPQRCCVALVPQLTRLRTMSTTATDLPPIKLSQLPAMRDFTVASLVRDQKDLVEIANAHSSLTALHLEHTWPSFQDLLPFLQAAHTRLVTVELSSSDPFTTQAYQDTVLCNPSLRHLIIARYSEEFVKTIIPLASQIRSLELTAPPSVGRHADYELLTQHFTRVTRLTLNYGDNRFNVEQLRAWQASHVREFVSVARPLMWVTAVLHTLPNLASLRLREMTISSNATKDDVKDFEAEVQKADRRGMERIDIERVTCTRSKYSVRYNTTALRRSLRWLAFSVGEEEALTP